MKYVYVISNGNTEIYTDNTLTKFTNEIQLNENKQYEIAICELFFDDKFYSSYLPKNENLPAIIVTKVKPDKISYEIVCNHLPVEEKWYFPHVELQGLGSIIDQCLNNFNTGLNKRISLWHQKKGNENITFGCYKSEKTGEMVADYEDYFCYIFDQLSNEIRDSNFSQEFPVYKTVEMEQIKFHVFKMNPLKKCFFVCDTFMKNLKTSFTPNVFIYCSNIKPTYLDNNHASLLDVIALDTNKGKRGNEVTSINASGFNCENQQLIFHKLVTESAANIQLQLLDDKKKQLDLKRGRATIARLALREIESEGKMDNIKITVTSNPQPLHEENVAWQFASELSENIPLYGSWEMALVSASLPKRFNLPFNERERVMYLKFMPSQGSVYTKTITLPKCLQSNHEIVDEINKYFTPIQLKCSVDYVTKCLIFEAGVNVTILMRKSFANFLGYATPPDDRAMSFNILANEKFNFPFPPKFADFLPSTIFLYSDIIKSTSVAGNLLKLLKVLPVDFTDKGQFDSNVRHITFKTLEFHKIERTLISTLRFYLRTQSGENVNFANDDNPVILNLLIRKFE